MDPIANAFGRRRARRGKRKLNGPTVDTRDFFAWVTSLPWVVERPYDVVPGVRSFGVDCPPLGLRRMWLVTGLGRAATDQLPVAVIVPNDVARSVEEAGWGRRLVDMPAGHVLVGAAADVELTSIDLEGLVLTGYRYAIA